MADYSVKLLFDVSMSDALQLTVMVEIAHLELRRVWAVDNPVHLRHQKLVALRHVEGRLFRAISIQEAVSSIYPLAIAHAHAMFVRPIFFLRLCVWRRQSLWQRLNFNGR